MNRNPSSRWLRDDSLEGIGAMFASRYVLCFNQSLSAVTIESSRDFVALNGTLGDFSIILRVDTDSAAIAEFIPALNLVYLNNPVEFVVSLTYAEWSVKLMKEITAAFDFPMEFKRSYEVRDGSLIKWPFNLEKLAEKESEKYEARRSAAFDRATGFARQQTFAL